MNGSAFIGRHVKINVSRTLDMVGTTLWVTAGTMVEIVGLYDNNGDFDDVANMLFMIAYKSSSFDAPYQFTVRGSMLEI